MNRGTLPAHIFSHHHPPQLAFEFDLEYEIRVFQLDKQLKIKKQLFNAKENDTISCSDEDSLKCKIVWAYYAQWSGIKNIMINIKFSDKQDQFLQQLEGFQY